MTKIQAPASTLQATRAFVAHLAHAYPKQQAILFGSCTRGTAHAESDADVAVILTGPPGHFVHTKMTMNDIAYDILLDTGIRIQPLPVCKAKRTHPDFYSKPYLLHNIAQEGITL